METTKETKRNIFCVFLELEHTKDRDKVWRVIQDFGACFILIPNLAYIKLDAELNKDIGVADIRNVIRRHMDYRDKIFVMKVEGWGASNFPKDLYEWLKSDFDKVDKVSA